MKHRTVVGVNAVGGMTETFMQGKRSQRCAGLDLTACASFPIESL
ncbi:MAG TPA: hypothetical protein VII23_16320 [Terriglobales bacterium]